MPDIKSITFMVEIPVAALALPFPAAALPLPAHIQYTFDHRHTATCLHTYNTLSLTDKQPLAAYIVVSPGGLHPKQNIDDANSDCNASVL